MDRQNRLPLFEELLREIGWMRISLTDFQEAINKFNAASDIGDVRGEPEEANHRVAILKGRMRCLVRVYKLFFAQARDLHNRRVEEQEAQEKDKIG